MSDLSELDSNHESLDFGGAADAAPEPAVVREPAVEPEPAGEPEPASPPVRARRATKKAATAKVTAPKSAAKPRTAKSRTAKAAASDELAELLFGADQPAVSADETPDPSVGSDVAPEPRVAAAELPATEVAAAERPADEIAADELPADEVAVDELPAGEVAADEPAEAAAGTAAPAAFGILFQPPASRRATRPAGSVRPAAAPAFTPPADSSAPEPSESAQSTDTPDGESAPEAAQQRAATGQTRSRRRGKAQQAAVDGAADEAPTDGSTAPGASASGEPDAPSQALIDEDESDDAGNGAPGRRRRRGGRGRRPRGGADGAQLDDDQETDEQGGTGPQDQSAADEDEATAKRRRRRRRTGAGGGGDSDDPPGTVTRVREPRRASDEPSAVRGSTRLEAKKLRRREGREAGRRRTIITEKEFLARRESVERVMVVRRRDGRTQIGVLEDGVLVEHYVSRTTNASMAGNVHLGRIQNVLPSMEAAFVDIGRGRNAVLYAGEVNWDTAGLEGGGARRIENALTSGESVLVQVTKDPMGHKGARLTSQISLPGRYLVYVPLGNMTGISRKLPDTERSRLKSILKEIVPPDAGVIVRTAAEGASEEELRRDVERLAKTWEKIASAAAAKGGKKATAGGAPALLYAEPDLTVRVIRDVFTEDFASLIVSGDEVWDEISAYVGDVAPDLASRMSRWTGEGDVFAAYRVDEQLAKALDRKVWLPSGGSLVIDRTEAMTVVDVNTGKFVGSGGNLEETVTKNNIEAAEEIVRQLRLRDIGGIIVIDFIDMVLESNRELVVRRLLECLGRDRTKHQVAEVTSLGLVQMTRKRVGSGLLEVFSESCAHCDGRGVIVSSTPVERGSDVAPMPEPTNGTSRNSRRGRTADAGPPKRALETPPRQSVGPTAAQIAAAAHAAAVKSVEVPVEQPDTLFADTAAETVTDTVTDPVTDLATDTATHPVMDPADTAADNLTDPATTAVTDPVMALATDSTDELGDAPDGQSRARGRRRRGRATSPAGPPRGVSEDEDGPGGDPSV